MLLASHIPRTRADDGHAHRDVGGAHVSPARKRGKSLDVHVEQLAKGNRLGVAQLGEVPRYVLDWAVTLAQLNGQRATSNVSDCRGVSVLRKRVGKRLSTDSRVRSRVAHDGRVTALYLARARGRERLDGFLTPTCPRYPSALEAKSEYPSARWMCARSVAT